jgi:hypothetical protein
MRSSGTQTVGSRCIVNCWAKIAALLLSIAALHGSAQSAPEDESRAQETQTRGFWADPSTGLMWAGKDSGKDLSFKSAVKYCHDLRLAGHSDWRLANMAELQGIYDKAANAPGLAGPNGGRAVMWHVKGNLFLTGNEWANNESGRTSGYQYYFDFNEGKSNNQPSGFPYPSTFMRGLCVRGSGDPLGGQR